MAFSGFADGQLRILRTLPVNDAGNRLAAALDLAGLTQEQLAAAVGLTQGYITNVVRGKQKPKLDKLHAFAGFFGCSIEDLFPARVEVA